MYFAKSLIGNSVAGAAQREGVMNRRMLVARSERMFEAAGLLFPNQGILPDTAYQEFDKNTVEIMTLDDGDVFLSDLMTLSHFVNIGTLVQKFSQVSDAGNAKTSMTGQTGVFMDQTDNKTAGTIVPIHDNGFFRNFREDAALKAADFDQIIDDQRETMKQLRRHLADDFLDGHKDAQNQTIVVDGISWAGMRNDARVSQVNIGASGINFDFTDTTKTFIEIEAAFKQVRNNLWLTNKCSLDAIYYVSNEIASNFERASSESFDSQKILQRLAGLQKVRELKGTSKLSGNELMAFPLDSGKIRPIVGMGMNTIAMPRPMYNSNHSFVNWAAIGFQVREDYNGNTCALFAQDSG